MISSENTMPYQSVFRPQLFNGQTIIVTGGGSGIGRCTAHELAALGANVAILGRTAEKLAQVKAEIEEDGGVVISQVCDIRDEAMVISAIDAVLGTYGRIDGLVNNAGGQYRAPMKSISTKGFEAVVRSNLTGGFIFMREVYNRWMEPNGGAIVNIIADIWHGWPEFAHSGAARDPN
jgi:citronellol/citronellal dehydrogenase